MHDFLCEMEMEWKKIVSMEYGKIVFHSITCPGSKSVFRMQRVEASHANAHARAIALFSYVWF